MVTGRTLLPAVVPALTTVSNEKTLSPAAGSPLVPSSNKLCGFAPPIELRSALTARFVLVGDEPGVTATFSTVLAPGSTAPGTALPIPDGSDGHSAPDCGLLGERNAKSVLLFPVSRYVAVVPTFRS